MFAASHLRTSRRAPLLWVCSCLAIVLGAAAAGIAAAGPSYIAGAAGGLTAQPVLGFPAGGATVIGASTVDSANAGEVWAEGRVGEAPATLPDSFQIARSEVLVRRTDALGDWQIVPVRDAAGKSLAAGWDAATVTPAGAVVLAGIAPTAGAPVEPGQILVQPADAKGFAAVAPIPAGTLQAGEVLSGPSPTDPPVLAALDEAGGAALFVAPRNESAAEPGLIHYAVASASWQREPICATDDAGKCVAPTAPIVVRAISASSSTNAWMLATPAGADGAVPQLYRRVPATGGTAGSVWLAQTVASPLLEPAAGLVVPGTGAPAGTNSGAILTASGDGVWVDLVKAGPAGDGSAGSATFFFSGTQVSGSWCSVELSCAGATGSLPADLPAGYGSFATTPGSGGSAGGRAITGLPHGAMLALEPGSSSFAYRITAGGEREEGGTVTPDNSGGNTVGPGGVALAPFLREGTAGLGGGAAFTSPTDAWLGIGGPTPGPQLVHVTGSPSATALAPWPLPFSRDPLLAVAGQPGTKAAGGEGEAIAVGTGQVLRFRPGRGWAPELVHFQGSLVGFPVVALRGVAWPSAEAAYVVGDAGQIFRWAPSTGWESDPGAPAGLDANLTAVAFSASNPGLGYAVGKGGVILSFSAGSWQQQPAPAGLEGADFSSVTFAGEEAIAAYRLPTEPETGGLIVNDGSGWRVDPTLPDLFAKAKLAHPVILKVAGLPDGGAVAAGPGIVVERDNASSPWRFSSAPLGELSEAGVSALAAYRDEAGQIRAIVSVDPDSTEAPNAPESAWNAADRASPPAPDPEPNQGFIVRETAAGWVDAELEDFPGINEPSADQPIDQPGWPDGVYALLADQAGASGWAVGGQSGGTTAIAPTPEEEVLHEAARVAATARFGSGPTPPVGEGPPLPSAFDQTGGALQQPFPILAFAGGSGCNAPCADSAAQSLGPNADLVKALTEAGQIPGLRGFVYAGRAIGWTAGEEDGSEAYARELGQFDSVLSAGGSPLPTYAVPNGPPGSGPGGDIQSEADEPIYQAALGSHVPTSSSVGPAPPAGTSAYAFDSRERGGQPAPPVRVIVLDFSQGNSAANQEGWMTEELAEAHSAGYPTLVVGADDIIEPGAPNHAADADAIVSILDKGLASGYIYNSLDRTDSTETFGTGQEMLAVGVGSLGYGNPRGQSIFPGIVLIGVLYQPGSAFPDGREPVLLGGQVPVGGQVALAGGPPSRTMKTGEATNFTGVLRRVQGGAGGLGTRTQSLNLPGPNCANQANCVFYPSAAFFTSDPTVGEFVVPKGPGEPEIDPKTGRTRAFTYEGLFCATSPGTTTITFDAGGETYSETLTVEQGPPGGACPQTQAETPAASEPAPAPAPSGPRPKPSKPPAPTNHHVAKHHHEPSSRPAAPAPHHPRPAPSTPSEGPPPAQPAPAAEAPKLPPTSAGAPPQPVPPGGVSTAPSPVGSNVPANVPASTPTTVPLQVPALERRSSAEVGLERSYNFAAYRPDDGSAALPAIALLLLAVGGAGLGGTALLARRSGNRALTSTRGGRRMALSQLGPRDDRRGRR